MTLSPENINLVLGFSGRVKGWAQTNPATLNTLLNAARAEATTTLAQTLATALHDLSAAENALVSQTALVRAQGERVAALEAGVRLIQAAATGKGHALNLIARECAALLFADTKGT